MSEQKTETTDQLTAAESVIQGLEEATPVGIETIIADPIYRMIIEAKMLRDNAQGIKVDFRKINDEIVMFRDASGCHEDSSKGRYNNIMIGLSYVKALETLITINNNETASPETQKKLIALAETFKNKMNNSFEITDDNMKYELKSLVRECSKIARNTCKKLEGKPVSSIIKQLDDARHWVALEEKTFAVATKDQLTNLTGDIPNQEIIRLDRPMFTAKERYDSLYGFEAFNDLDEKGMPQNPPEWYGALSDFNKQMVLHYKDKIGNERILPSQLRAILPGLKNSYQQSTARREEGTPYKLINSNYHAGTVVTVNQTLMKDEEKTAYNSELAANAMRQQREASGMSQSSTTTLNAEFGDRVRKKQHDVKKVFSQKAREAGWVDGVDDHIVTYTRSGAEQVEGISSGNVCLNSFRTIMRNDYQSASDLIALANSNLKTFESGEVSEDAAKIIDKLKKTINDLENALNERILLTKDEKAQGMKILAFCSKLSHVNNECVSAVGKGDTHAFWYGCASGDNRTGFTSFHIMAKSVKDDLFEAYSEDFSKGAANQKSRSELSHQIKSQLAQSGHVATMTGLQGGDMGTGGMRSKSAKSDRKKYIDVLKKAGGIRESADHKNYGRIAGAEYIPPGYDATVEMDADVRRMLLRTLYDIVLDKTDNINSTWDKLNDRLQEQKGKLGQEGLENNDRQKIHNTIVFINNTMTQLEARDINKTKPQCREIMNEMLKTFGTEVRLGKDLLKRKKSTPEGVQRHHTERAGRNRNKSKNKRMSAPAGLAEAHQSSDAKVNKSNQSTKDKAEPITDEPKEKRGIRARAVSILSAVTSILPKTGNQSDPSQRSKGSLLFRIGYQVNKLVEWTKDTAVSVGNRLFFGTSENSSQAETKAADSPMQGRNLEAESKPDHTKEQNSNAKSSRINSEPKSKHRQSQQKRTLFNRKKTDNQPAQKQSWAEMLMQPPQSDNDGKKQANPIRERLAKIWSETVIPAKDRVSAGAKKLATRVFFPNTAMPEHSNDPGQNAPKNEQRKGSTQMLLSRIKHGKKGKSQEVSDELSKEISSIKQQANESSLSVDLDFIYQLMFMLQQPDVRDDAVPIMIDELRLKNVTMNDKDFKNSIETLLTNTLSEDQRSSFKAIPRPEDGFMHTTELSLDPKEEKHTSSDSSQQSDRQTTKPETRHSWTNQRLNGASEFIDQLQNAVTSGSQEDCNRIIKAFRNQNTGLPPKQFDQQVKSLLDKNPKFKAAYDNFTSKDASAQPAPSMIRNNA